MKRLRLLASVGLGLALHVAAPAGADQSRPGPLREVAFDQKLGEQLPLDVPFRDETGATVHLRDYFGSKPVLLVPAYYECPMLCTLVLNGVVSALRAVPFDIGKEFTVVTFSFNPKETATLAAEKKEHYITQYRRPGAELGWHFLTGDEASIRAVTDAIGFHYSWDEASQQYAHASGAVVVTPSGKLARYFYGVEFAPRDLRLAFVEAADDKIGTLVEQLLLFCFHYDPATGRYSAAILNGVRLAGLATIMILGTFIVRSARTV